MQSINIFKLRAESPSDQKSKHIHAQQLLDFLSISEKCNFPMGLGMVLYPASKNGQDFLDIQYFLHKRLNHVALPFLPLPSRAPIILPPTQLLHSPPPSSPSYQLVK